MVLTKIIETLKLYLSYEKWLHTHHPKSEVENAGSLVGKLIAMIKQNIQRETGLRWKIPKIHSLMRMWIYVLKWGCGEGFYGGVSEHNLIKMVKYSGKNTQHKVDCFSSQVATRYYETKILELAWECDKMQLGLDGMKVKKTETLIELEGLLT